MAKAVFTTKVIPTYDDLPEHQYHFRRTYLRQAEQTVGDWIVYYEPRRPSADLMKAGGRQAYFATARVDQIVGDSRLPDRFYAEVSGFLEITRSVPFRDKAHYYESGLQKADGSTNKGPSGAQSGYSPMKSTTSSGELDLDRLTASMKRDEFRSRTSPRICR